VAGCFSFLTGCKNKVNSNDNNVDVVSSNQNQEEKLVGYQLEKPIDGEEIAVFSTSYGKFSVRLFPDVAPKAVKNFTTHAEEGYFNGLRFHRVIENFMIQSGDPKGDGTGGESIFGRCFEDEFSPKVFNITGSLSMANSGPNTNKSQFFINYNPPEKLKNLDSISSIDTSKLTKEIRDLYKKNGGNPFLDGGLSKNKKGHTVFGQVFDGLDVVSKIASCETKGKNEKSTPKEDIIIHLVEIKKFEQEN
jgi:cyclophilin family peptidyl-prolyl cis-trans isomerase